MNPTDQQLQLALAKMLPEKLKVFRGEVWWIEGSTISQDGYREGAKVHETQWLPRRHCAGDKETTTQN